LGFFGLKMNHLAALPLVRPFGQSFSPEVIEIQLFTLFADTHSGGSPFLP
jgi:hypothetical protein